MKGAEPPNGVDGRLFGHIMLMRKTQSHDEPHMWPQPEPWESTTKQILFGFSLISIEILKFPCFVARGRSR